MLHVLIIADFEGIIDVYDFENIDKSRELYIEEVQVYIKALLENGVDKITVCDAHDEGRLISQKITESSGADRCKIEVVSQVYGVSFDEKYDFAILVGYHGMEGSLGILPHTLRFDFKEISVVDSKYGINIPIGEVELYSRWLGSYGIPVIFVSGDRAAVYEANCFNPYRQVCCVKSCFQSGIYDRSLLYEKLANNLKCALKLDRELCLSEDNSEIEVEFHNLDVTDALGAMGYNKRGNKLLFSSCADFVNGLYDFVNYLKQINNTTWQTNVAFLKEVRELAKSLQKEDVAESEVGPLLNNNLLFMDKISREEIISGLKAIAEKSGT